MHGVTTVSILHTYINEYAFLLDVFHNFIVCNKEIHIVNNLQNVLKSVKARWRVD